MTAPPATSKTIPVIHGELSEARKKRSLCYILGRAQPFDRMHINQPLPSPDEVPVMKTVC
jgi:hypothetical protein